MKQTKDYSDVRNRGACIHCGEDLKSRSKNKDHVPTKCLLDRPLPDNLPTITICEQCNTSFSKDEEYLCIFLTTVLTGHLDPDPNQFPKAAASLKNNFGLRTRISRARREHNEGTEVSWQPEIDRVHHVIAKNARGHVFFELGEPLAYPPSLVECLPVSQMTVEQRDAFERISPGSFWPEVGSRLFQRVVGTEPIVDGWISVQEGVYRYAIVQNPGEVVVRTMIRDYLATEVAWEY